MRRAVSSEQRAASREQWAANTAYPRNCNEPVREHIRLHHLDRHRTVGTVQRLGSLREAVQQLIYLCGGGDDEAVLARACVHAAS